MGDVPLQVPALENAFDEVQAKLWAAEDALGNKQDGSYLAAKE